MKRIKRVNNGRITGGFILLVFLYSSQFYRHKCKCCIHIEIKINIILAQKREFLDLHQDQLAYWEWDKRPIEDVIRKACTRENESIVNWKLRHPTFNLSVNSSFIWNLTRVFFARHSARCWKIKDKWRCIFCKELTAEMGREIHPKLTTVQ